MMNMKNINFKAFKNVFKHFNAAIVSICYLRILIYIGFIICNFPCVAVGIKIKLKS